MMLKSKSLFATPAETHAKLAIQAMRAGKGCVCREADGFNY